MSRPSIAVNWCQRRPSHNSVTSCVPRPRCTAGMSVSVNQRETAIEGHTAYRTLADVRCWLERISVYLPAEICLQVLPELTKKNAQQCGQSRADDPGCWNARGNGLAVVVGCRHVRRANEPTPDKP